MRALFDRYLVVDWSAANTPKTGRDSIWLALAERTGHEARIVSVLNPATRAAAMDAVRRIAAESLEQDLRLFVGFDFPFGYPAGAALAIAGEAGWRSLWARIAALVQDRDDNVSNRFEVGGRLNRDVFADAPMFWGRPDHLHIPGLTPTRPPAAPGTLPEFRLAERRARPAQPVWKLAFPGSVGSQALTGIARLHALLADERFGAQLAVWPFETEFDARLGAQVILAEIYPSVFHVEQNGASCRDEAEVRALAEGFAGLDARGRFRELLQAPADLSEDEKKLVLEEEGWIVGLGQALPAEADDAHAHAPRLSYLRDPADIYAASFATIRAEAGLDSVPAEAHDLAIRLIHACGMVDIAGDLVVSPGAIEAGRLALAGGAPVLCDAEMVAQGIIRQNLPASNPVVCRLNDPAVPSLAKRLQTTRSAAQVELWDGELEGAVVAIGNAPTALFRLLERLDEGAPKPALILAFPVGFVGAAESKEELIRDSRGVPFVTLRGRRGGSAMAAAAANALAAGLAPAGTPGTDPA